MSLIDQLVREAERLEADGDLVTAHSKLEEAAKSDSSGSVQWRLGRSLMLQGQLAQAIATLRDAIERDPEDAEAKFMLGFSYKQQDRLDEAKIALENGLKLREWAAARALLGEIYRQLDDIPAAREHIENALEQEPTNSEAWYSLGLTYRHHDKTRAEALFRRAIEADQTNSAALRELGFVQWQTGMPELAESWLLAALKIAPDDVWAHCYLGAVLKQLGRLREAEAECRHAVRLQPNEPLFWCNLGDVLALKGQWDDAEQCYLSALSKDMSYYLANLQYGKFLNKRGYPSRAIDYLQRALNADPTNEKTAALLKSARSKVKSQL